MLINGLVFSFLLVMMSTWSSVVAQRSLPTRIRKTNGWCINHEFITTPLCEIHLFSCLVRVKTIGVLLI
jgi:hypothetical protein